MCIYQEVEVLERSLHTLRVAAAGVGPVKGSVSCDGNLFLFLAAMGLCGCARSAGKLSWVRYVLLRLRVPEVMVGPAFVLTIEA